MVDAYEKLGRGYLKYRDNLKSAQYIKIFCKNLPKKACVLDVGCGLGIPVDDVLIKSGFDVTGIDLSPSFVREARKLVPEASYMVRDMCEISAKEYSFDGIVCLYVLFHIPRAEHLKMLKIFASCLLDNGYLLISMGDTAFEGEHEMYGVKSYSSQWGRQKNLEIVTSAGFLIEKEELSYSGGECHQMILARKNKTK